MQPGSLLAAVSEGPTAQRVGLCILRYLILTARYNGLQVSHWLLIAARCSHCMPSNTRFHLLQRWCNVLGFLLNLTLSSCVADVDLYTPLPLPAGCMLLSSSKGYHRYLRRLLSSYCASPSLAHSILLEFNYRWNVKMAVKNGGLPSEVGGFYDQFEIEIIQRDTASWLSLIHI